MTIVLRISLLIITLVLGSGIAPSKAGHDDPSDPKQPKMDTASATPSTCPPSPDTSIGTAWPLENGYVVTNYHVVAGSKALALQNTYGQQFSAKPVLVDPANDLALLAVENTQQLPPALPLCSIEAPTGTSVFTLGFPRVDRLGYAPKYTDGMISSATHPMGNSNRYLTTVSIQPGNSGGPLLNTKGEVVGIVTAMLGLRNESTGAVKLLPNQSSAIKIGKLRRLMNQLPAKNTHMRLPFEPGLPIQALCNQLKDSMLVVIVHGGNG